MITIHLSLLWGLICLHLYFPLMSCALLTFSCKIRLYGNSGWIKKSKTGMERRAPSDASFEYSAPAAGWSKPLGLICYLVANKSTLSRFPLNTTLCKIRSTGLWLFSRAHTHAWTKKVSCAKKLIFIQRIMPSLAWGQLLLPFELCTPKGFV